jgi:hypothetical protein
MHCRALRFHAMRLREEPLGKPGDGLTAMLSCSVPFPALRSSALLCASIRFTAVEEESPSDGAPWDAGRVALNFDALQSDALHFKPLRFYPFPCA